MKMRVFKNVHFHKQMYGGNAQYANTYLKLKIKCASN